MCGSYVEIVVTTRVTKSKFCIVNSLILDSALKNLVATVMWLLEFIHH